MKTRWSFAPANHRGQSFGFTLLELLVACTVFLVLLVLLLSIVNEASRIWQQSNNQKTSRETARILMTAISRDLSGATFPMDMTDKGTLEMVSDPPSLTASLLNPHALFWQAPLPGASGRGELQEVGYFVRWVTNVDGIRGELCRYYLSATNTNSIFNGDSGNWISSAKVDQYAPGSSDADTHQGLLAENVLGLWITLLDRHGTVLSSPYSSRSQPLPALAVVEVAIADAQIARRITSSDQVTSLYAAPSIKAFVDSLPPHIRQGTRIFRGQFRIEGER